MPATKMALLVQEGNGLSMAVEVSGPWSPVQRTATIRLKSAGTSSHGSLVKTDRTGTNKILQSMAEMI